MAIEQLLIAYLINKTSAGTNVYCERPITPPDEYIVLEKTGTSTNNMITTSTIAIQSISNSLEGGSMLQAITLNDEVKDALLGGSDDYGLVELDEIVSVNLNSDYNFTDTETKEYRYQAIFNITHY